MQNQYIKTANVSEEERNKLYLAKIAMLAGYQTDLSNGDLYMYTQQSDPDAVKKNPPVVRIKKGKMYNAEILQSLINICKAEKIDFTPYLKGFSTDKSLNVFYYNVVNDLVYKNHIKHHNNIDEINDTKNYMIDGAVRTFVNYAGYAGISNEGISAACKQLGEEWQEITEVVESKGIKQMLGEDQGIPEVE